MIGAGGPSDEASASDFEVSVEPSPKSTVIEAVEDEDSKRARDAALASTFDQALAHDGKTEEEMLEERQADTRLLVDVAIVAGIAIAVAEANDENDPEPEAIAPTDVEEDDGGD